MKLKNLFKKHKESTVAEAPVYRLRHLQFYNKNCGLLSKTCIDIEFDFFCSPSNMDKESVFKVVSYWLDCLYEANDEFERQSIYYVTRLNILLKNRKTCFKEVENSGKCNIIDLFVVCGNLKKVKKRKEYKNYFEWYIPGITKEEVELIYKKCGLKYEDLLVKTSISEKCEEKELYSGVLAVPCNRPFVVAADKAGAFKNVQPNLELRKENERLLSKLNITDLTNNDNVESEKVYVKKFKK